MNRYRWVLRDAGTCVGYAEISEGKWPITAVGEERADGPKALKRIYITSTSVSV
jgi:hypothetical protein